MIVIDIRNNTVDGRNPAPVVSLAYLAHNNMTWISIQKTNQK